MDLDINSHRDSIPDRINPDLNMNHNGVQEAREEDLRNKLFVEMRNNVEDSLRYLERCKWLIMVPSCLFVTVLSWDIVGDEVGWVVSYWIPLMGVVIMVTLWMLDYYLEES